jgi:ketosteroid isomerase-like protein
MKQLQEYFTIYVQAAWDKDIESMIRLYDHNVVIYDMWTNGYQTGLTEWSGVIKTWLSSLGEERVKVTFEMIKIHESGDIGFASALITYQAMSADNAILRSMKNRVTIGFHKEKDMWKVIHQHTSAPINSKLVAILDF